MQAVKEVAQIKENTKMRGRKIKAPKPPKPPTKLERVEKLRNRILSLKEDLIDRGFGQFLPPPTGLKLTGVPEEDPKTEGLIGTVIDPLGLYIQRVSVADNFSQRPPFDHAKDPIYRRLIRDFIMGAAMPASKVAALSGTGADRRLRSLDEAGIHFSVIDGLQRLYCFCIAMLLVLEREKLSEDGLLPADAWEYFKDAVNSTGESKEATQKLLQRPIRYEIFYNIDLAGLLHYMVTFNTGQRRMSLPAQLEIMQRPLIQELAQRAKIPVWEDLNKRPGEQQPKHAFAASTLVLAAQAFITNNAQLTPADEAERFLNEDQAYLDNVGDIDDVVKTLKRLTTELHPAIMELYASDPSRRYILSGGGTFLIGLVAACGYVRNRGNQKILEGALDKLMDLVTRPVDDPLSLEAYKAAGDSITTSRGRTTRRLVYDTFLRFFSGATTQLEWEDTARQISGATS
jgi:hypothetical protein